ADSVEHGTYMDEECVALMKAHGTYFVPTLAITQTLADHGLEMGYQPNIPTRARIAVGRGRASVAMCHAAGVPMAAGTDPVACDRMVDECRSLLQCGLNPMEVIEAATRVAAMVIGVQDRLGTLETGKIADVVVLAGNPLEDIQALE